MENNTDMVLIGNCTMDDVIEELFGDVNHFACLVEDLGDEFTVGNITVKYDEDKDIHSFYFNNKSR